MTAVHRQWIRLGMRSMLWFAAAFGLLFLVRVPFLLIHYVPYHLPFEPWVALIPLVGVLWGVPAILAVGAATALGDWMGGLRGALPVWHTLAMMAWAWSARSLWNAQAAADGADQRDADPYPEKAAFSVPLTRKPEPSVSWSGSFHFLAISLPGALIAASMMALGADISRSYPFSYAAFISASNHLFFLLVFGVALYRVFERQVTPLFGSQDQLVTPPRHPSWLGMVLQIAGAVGAWGIGYVVAVRLGFPARGPAVLGDTAGLRLLPGVVPFLLLFGFGLLCPGQRREAGGQDASIRNAGRTR